jgi:antimicrobial peptide system SdpB family protein
MGDKMIIKLIHYSRVVLGIGTILTIIFNDIFLMIPEDYYFNIVSLKNESVVYNLNLFSHFKYEYLNIAKWVCVVLIALTFFFNLNPFFVFIHYTISLSVFHSFLISEGGDQINMILMLIIFIFSLAISFSNSIIKKSIELFIFTVKLQASIIYLQASVAKLYVQEWSDGTAIYYWLNHNIFGLPIESMKFINKVLIVPEISFFITFSVIIFELVISYVIWANFNNKIIFLILGLLFHFGIFIIHSLPTFFLSMSVILILSFSESILKLNQINKYGTCTL